MSRALGRYELLRPLARGGMAEVYLARRKAAGVEKWLVVKRIRAQLSGDVRFHDLFVREARLSMSLTHQNIVPVFDFGRIDDQVFLAMERVEGKDLGSSLARAGERRLPPLVAAFIASECCQALDYAHRRKSPEGTALGIVHRDVTPRNVLLSWSGEVKLTDFGIAALAGDATTKLIGTPAYMAPEQARGEPVDARADVYALGLVLRELLTGERARPGGEREISLTAARTGELVPWTAGVPDALTVIVDRATSPAADARFPDARAMLEALDDFSVGERAANKGDAPARQLAAWLAEVWGDEREDDTLDGQVQGDHLVSFLDDGGLDVMGTGTERSMAATAAGDDDLLSRSAVAAPGTGAPPAADSVASAAHAAALSASTSASDAAAPPASPAAASASSSAALSASTSESALAANSAALASARSRAPLILAALAGALGTGGLYLLARGGGSDRAAAPDAAVVAVTPTDAATAVTPLAIDAAAVPPPVDAAVSPAPIDAAVLAPIDAAVRAPTDAGVKIRPKPTADAAVAQVSPPPSIEKRKVKINAVPWAYFTVDGDSTRYQTVETILLAPGRHTIHFDNPELGIKTDKEIEVPADRDTTVVEQLKTN